jgi:hypothetical protein
MTPPSAPVLAVPLLAVALLLGGCGSNPSTPAGPAPATSPAPTMAPPVAAVPPADGPVTGQGTVLQTPDGPPQLCLGAVAESWPPQCRGVPLDGWDWATAGPHETADLQGRQTRWGTYAVTGRFDGTTMTVTGSVPLALYDVAAEPSPRPSAPPTLSAQQWDAVQAGLRAAPGLLTAERTGDTGPVQALVVHDDGSIQAWADASFGAGVVLVTSALR